MKNPRHLCPVPGIGKDRFRGHDEALLGHC
jgi:hypothetical protein